MSSWALVTGTSTGIGSALVDGLLDRGWRVLGVSRRAVERENENYAHIELDLADPEQLDRFTRVELPRFLEDPSTTRVGLVNNAAAIGTLRALGHASPQEVARIFAVNTIAPMHLMGTVAKQAPKNVPLRVINLSTGAAGRGIPGLGDYGGSKAALRLVGMTLAEEMAQREDIEILSYEPGIVDTPMQVEARSADDNEFPSAQVFKGFHESGSLQPAESVVVPMLSFLDGRSGERFSEKRFEP